MDLHCQVPWQNFRDDLLVGVHYVWYYAKAEIDSSAAGFYSETRPNVRTTHRNSAPETTRVKTSVSDWR